MSDEWLEGSGHCGRNLPGSVRLSSAFQYSLRVFQRERKENVVFKGRGFIRRPVSLSPFGRERGWREGSAFERLARRFQIRRFPTSIRALVNADTRVVVTDDVLKFHTDDRRVEFREAYEKICKDYGVDP